MMILGAEAALRALTGDGWVCNVGARDREGCALAWAASGGQMRRRGTGTVKTRIEEKCARTLELPLLVRRLVYSFSFVSTGG